MHNARNHIKKILSCINYCDLRLLNVRLIFFWMMLKLVYILVIVIPKLDNAELPMWDRIKVVIDRWYIYISHKIQSGACKKSPNYVPHCKN